VTQLQLDLDPFDIWENGPHLVWRCPGCACECAIPLQYGKHEARTEAMSEWAIYQALGADEVPGARKIGGSWRIHRRTALRAFGVDVDE